MIETTPWLPAPVAAPRPAFAIADIHGEAARLGVLHAHIAATIRDDRLANALLVHLGDYADRGPDSLGAIDRVRRGLGLVGVEERSLAGNHEQILLGVLSASSPQTASFFLGWWIRNGGWTVLRQLHYACEAGPETSVESLGDPMLVIKRLKEALGAENLAFLASLDRAVLCGKILFVHAGIHPYKDVALFLKTGLMDFNGREQDHWAWIREPFLSWSAPFPNDVFVVHGHTITENRLPDLRANRLGLDCGAFIRAPLAAVEFRGDRLRFHLAHAS